MSEPSMKFIAFDLGLLAAASTVGIYAATARLTLLGWLMQYKYADPSPLTRRNFVKRQISCLTWFVFAALVSGTLALAVIGLEVLQEPYVGVMEFVLVAVWVLIIICFLAFHVWVEGVYQDWWSAPPE